MSAAMDVEKTMQFILEQNAANTVQIQQLTADIAELKEVTQQHTVHLETLTAHLEVHTTHLEVHTEWKLDMSQALQDLAEQMKEGFTELTSAQGTTEESLNILIRTVQDILPRSPKE
jgi:Co/Zn/Cd efflux system component